MPFILAMLAFCWWVPAAQEFTGLPVAGSLIALGVLVSTFLVVTFVEKRGALPNTVVGTVILTSMVIELFPALLMGLSHMPGTALFAGFYLLTVLVHSRLLRFSRRFPLLSIAFVVSAALSLAINHDAAHLTIWILMLPAAIVAGLIFGSSALSGDEHRYELERTRAALNAQLLDLESQKQRLLEDRVQGLLGVQHDLKSPLMAATMEIDGLVEALKSPQELSRAELSEYGGAAARALQRVCSLFDRSRSVVTRPDLLTEPQDVGTALSDVVVRCHRRFPTTQFHARVDGPVWGGVIGGVATLERIVDNVVVNACEGNGQRGAHNVWCSVTTADGMVVLTCDDDGPGFVASALAGEIESFRSTKAQGTGLGLFTVERLARACGGGVERANRAEGGARVVVRLPQASVPAV